MKILIAEGESEISEAIQMILRIRMPLAEVIVTGRGEEAVSMAGQEDLDFIILDLDLPDIDGFVVLQRIREFSDVPILVLDGRTPPENTTQEVRAFVEGGADDYMRKPFDHLVLMVRIQAISSRSNGREWQYGGTIRFDDVIVDLNARNCLKNGCEVRITPIEWIFLAYFVMNAGRIIPHRLIAEKVWKTEDVGVSAIKMCVYRLRQKLGDDSRNPRLILSHRGLGYSLALPASARES